MPFDGTFIFEVAFDVDVQDTPTSGDWTDLSDRIRVDEGVTITYGTPEGGRCSLALDNIDRALDPTNTAAALNLVPMRHARLQVTVGATTYPLWLGFVEEWPPYWGDDGTDGIVRVTLVDATVWLALVDTNLDLAAQTTSERITALLDLAGWPAGARDLGVGVVRLDAYAQESGNLLRVLIDSADAEDGDLYVAPDGDVTFRSRHARLDVTAVLTAGDGGVGVQAVEPVYGGNEVVNIARAEMANGDVYEVTDATSVDTYGNRTAPVRDLPLPWHEAVGLADWIVHRYAQPSVWLDGLTLRSNPSLATILGLRMGDLIDFAHTPPGSGSVAYSGHVEKIVHTVNAAGWATVLDVSPYFGEGPWLEWKSDAAATGDGWLSDVATEGAMWAP